MQMYGLRLQQVTSFIEDPTVGKQVHFSLVSKMVSWLSLMPNEHRQSNA
jgi:hypothetical protein